MSSDAGPEKCRECKIRGHVPDVLPYTVTNSKGELIIVWLHQKCSRPYYEKHRRWRGGLAQ